jgi:FBP C-terminal treble-clef zinc-finger
LTEVCGGLAFTVVGPLTEQQIRAAFVNCSKGEAKRLHVPRDLAGQPWADLDFLGGAYLCADLACSLYTRGKKFTASSTRFQEKLTLEEQVERNVANLAAFLAKVTA